MVDYVFTDGASVFVKVRTDAVDANTNNFTILEVNDAPGGFGSLSSALQKSFGKKLDLGPVGDLSSTVSIGYLTSLATTLGYNLLAYVVGPKTPLPFTPVVSQTLSAPTLTAATGSGGTGTLALSWTAVTHATNYVVDRATNAGFTTGVTLGVFSGSALLFNDSGLTGGNTYYYRVRAQNPNAGYTDSAFSTVQSAAAHA